MKERIQKVLSRAGVASRRECERLLLDGRIRVNGQVVTVPGTKVGLEDEIEVDGQPASLSQEPSYVVMYKPRGCVTTMSDPQGRSTVLDHLPRTGTRLFPVGRLDYDSEGLLLFTNDGELAHSLTRPQTGVPKTYQVKVRGRPDEATLKRLSRPFLLEGRMTRPARVQLQVDRPNAVLTVILHEGRKHQIREMFHRVKHPVMRLRRIAYGPLRAPELRSGQTRQLTRQEVQALKSAVASSGPMTQGAAS